MKHPNSLAAILVAVTAFLVLVSSKPQGAANAIAERRNGLDVYVHCTPSRPYEIVSSEKFTVFADCEELFTKPPKKAEGKGDGVIIHTESARYDVIRYK